MVTLSHRQNLISGSVFIKLQIKIGKDFRGSKPTNLQLDWIDAVWKRPAGQVEDRVLEEMVFWNKNGQVKLCARGPGIVDCTQAPIIVRHRSQAAVDM